MEASALAFLFATILESNKLAVARATWGDLGSAEGEIREVITAQGIDLTDPEVAVEICKMSYGGRDAAFVDVSYTGGGSAPDPFRFIYLVSSGKYIGFAGDVAS